MEGGGQQDTYTYVLVLYCGSSERNATAKSGFFRRGHSPILGCFQGAQMIDVLLTFKVCMCKYPGPPTN